jgi:hypothetical protein
MVVAAWSVASAVSRIEMVHLAIQPSCSAPFSHTAVLRFALGPCSSMPPDVLALPGPGTASRTPAPPAAIRDRRVAPLAATRRTIPGRELTQHSLAFDFNHALHCSVPLALSPTAAAPYSAKPCKPGLFSAGTTLYNVTRDPAAPTNWCNCLSTLSPSRALQDILDEAVEFAKGPSRDELSDIAFGVGRLVGAFLRRPYISVPGDKLHVEKITLRMNEYGCVRSRRHLVNGACPTVHDLRGGHVVSGTVYNDEA